MLHHFSRVEEFSDTDLFQKSLSSPCLQQQFPSKMRYLTRFQYSQLNGFIERITRQHIPMRKHRKNHRLAQSRSAEVGLKSKALYCRNFDSENVQRCARLWFFKGYMCSPPHQNGINRFNAVLRA
jgi:hypothetical protein